MSNQKGVPEVREPDEDDDYDDVPLQHKRPFGAGLHRKQAIAFVPASSSLKSVDDTSLPTTKPHPNIADLYLSMVLPKDDRPKSAPPPETNPLSAPPPPNPPSQCPICNLPLNPSPSTSQSQSPSPSKGIEPPAPHEYSFAHQLCLPHSHPPSSLNRTRKGLSILASHGWDPDARLGLGADQQGTPYPVKAKVKDNKLGIGLHIPKGAAAPPKKKEQLLDARKVRKMGRDEVRRGERVRQELFGDGRLEKYLGRAEGKGI